jgi:hypothetical protein
MNYAVTFTAHIDELVAPMRFPSKVQDVVMVQVDSLDGLTNFVNDRMAMYIKNKGLGISVDKQIKEALNIEDTDRMWLPYRYIAYVTASHKLITGEVPGYNEEGKTAYPSGKEVVKN